MFGEQSPVKNGLKRSTRNKVTHCSAARQALGTLLIQFSAGAYITVPAPPPTPLPRAENCHQQPHTPSIAFRHLPPDSARFGYTTEGALFISAQLSSDAVSAL